MSKVIDIFTREAMIILPFDSEAVRLASCRKMETESFKDEVWAALYEAYYRGIADGKRDAELAAKKELTALKAELIHERLNRN